MRTPHSADNQDKGGDAHDPRVRTTLLVVLQFLRARLKKESPMLRMEADGAASELTEKLWRTPRFRELFDGQDLTPQGCAYVCTAVRRKVQDLLDQKQQATAEVATLHAYAQHLELQRRGSNDNLLNHLISEERRERIRRVLDAYCDGDPRKHAYFGARMAGRRHNAAAREAGVEWEGRCRGWWNTLRKRLEVTPLI